MEFTDSVAPGPNDHGRRCRRNPEICARRRAFLSPDEVVNGVEADQSHDDQIDRHDEAQQRGTIRIKMPARRATSGVMWAMW
jgi:hypothetical protein